MRPSCTRSFPTVAARICSSLIGSFPSGLDDWSMTVLLYSNRRRKLILISRLTAASVGCLSGGQQRGYESEARIRRLVTRS